MDELILKSYQFRREREASWQELDGLLRRMEAGSARSLSEAELMRLPTLYRAALSSLSVARSISLDQSLLVYLEDLANRAYFQVYGPRAGLGEMAGEFLLRRFPAAVRTLHRPILLAGFLMLLGLAAGWLLADRDPEWFYSLVPQNLAEGRLPTATTEALRQQLYEDPAAGAKDRLSVFASYLLLHNSAVGIAAFALGVALGVPTVLLMLDNGLILGAMLALYAGRGLGTAFGGWLVIHGSTELTAVTLCGGAGLALADALLFPGRRRRSEALAAAGRVAGLVVLGAILMLLVAGLLEGFARQLVTDDVARYAIGSAMAVAWLLYFRFAGTAARR